MPLDVRFRFLDGSTETHASLDLGATANRLPRELLQTLDGEGWWRSFRDSGTVDPDGFSVFTEDPTFPRIKNRAPRTLAGTVLDERGAPLPSANVAAIDRRDGEIIGQGLTNEAGHFHFTAATTKDRVAHHYVVTRSGISYDLLDASVVTETEDIKRVELRVRP